MAVRAWWVGDDAMVVDGWEKGGRAGGWEGNWNKNKGRK
jgi:hypothetical protein